MSSTVRAYADIEECRVTYYTQDPAENDGYTTTADGTKLDHTKNIIAVTPDMYDSLKHTKIRIDGANYTVRDICSSCTDEYLSVDMLVASKSIANTRGVHFTECEFLYDGNDDD
jgi:3D (Asp-Asp-Asp) domain-containing protein